MTRKSDDSDTIEREALILHRLDTGPASRFSSISKVANERYSDEMMQGDEEMGIPIRPPSPVLDKTGRPEWLENGIKATKTSKRLRLYLFLGLILTVAGIFTFAFSSEDEGGKTHKVYQWAGDFWRAGGGKAGGPYLFPTDIGYSGPTQTGKPAALADEDRYAATPTRGSSPINTALPSLNGFDAFDHMGPLTPYRSAPDFSISTAKYRSLASGCEVDRVHILHRHGSRYPTSGSPAYLIKKLLKEKKQSLKFSGPLSFLEYYDGDRLGSELLVGLGRQQLYQSGVLHEMQYGRLVEQDLQKHQRLLIRTGSQQRIVDSSIAFLQGMFGAKWHSKTDLEVQIEAQGFNTTLAPNFACAQAYNKVHGKEWQQSWQEDYLKSAVTRLQSHIEGVELNATLVNAMQQLCSYDTVAFGRSDFCPLFTQEEWLGYEYAWDLNFFGVSTLLLYSQGRVANIMLQNYGDGSSVGKAQGLGWVNEFMSRLTKTEWNSSTQTSENRTLNENPTTFPIDRDFYADFTHDSTIAGVISALNLLDFTTSLPIHKPDSQRKYKTSNLVPYAARLIFEEISCSSSPSKGNNDGRIEFIRMLLNEAIVDLHQYKECSSRSDGMCLRNEFISALSKRNEWSDWQNCTTTT